MTGSAVLIQYMSCDGRTDYGIVVAYTRYSIGLLSRVKKSNAINFIKAFRHAGQLFETARLWQTKSSVCHNLTVFVRHFLKLYLCLICIIYDI